VTSRLAAVLHSLLNTAGVIAAVHLDRRGRAIPAPAWRTIDLSAAGDRARGLLEQWNAVGRDLHAGGVVSMLLDATSGPVMITPLPDDATLLVMGDQECPPGRVRVETRRASAAIAAVGGEVQVPSPGAGAERVEDRAATAAEPAPREDAGAAALPEARDDPAAAGNARPSARTGEVVLLGAHTFRLVRRLVAQLLETKGVRTASLRAYSPVSTVVDVVLEEEATLAAIGPADLQEFAVERTEEHRSRLVLRPAKGRRTLRSE
jgi:predicted regulator of Ras-like GTPase activity (Roadblock/LC7/MglB family)